MQVGIGYKSGYKSYSQSTPRRKKFVRTISRATDSAKSIARVALKDKEVLKYFAVGMGKLLKYELKTLCSRNVDSVLRSCDQSDIINFPWNEVLKEVNEHCPLLMSLLNASTATPDLMLD